MFGGIGAKGGKKDLKQTQKNFLRNKKKQDLSEIGQEEKQIKKKDEEILRFRRTPVEFEDKEDLIETRLEEASINKDISLQEKSVSKKENIQMDINDEELWQPQLKTKEPHPLREEENKDSFPTLFDEFEERERKEKNSELQKREKKLERISTIQEERLPKEKDLSLNLKPEFAKSDEKDQKNISTKQAEKQQGLEEFLELKITNEFERILKDSRYQLKKLYSELEEIDEKKDSFSEMQDTEEAIDEIERLLSYLERIKRQLEIIKKEYSLDHIYQLEDSYFSGLVEKYKNNIRKKQEKNFFPREEATSLVQKILEFEQKKESLSSFLIEKQENLKLRDDNFDQFESQYLNLERVTQELESLVEDSNDYLKKIEAKVNETVNVTKRTEIKLHYTMGVLTRGLLLFSLLRMNPKPKANAITAVEALVTTSLIRQLLNPRKEERIITEYHFEDYHSMIENAIGDVDSICNLIERGQRQVKDLKKEFEKEFKEYETVFPEYQQIQKSITAMEKMLIEREENMDYVKGEMKSQLDKNNQKVLLYERLSKESY